MCPPPGVELFDSNSDGRGSSYVPFLSTSSPADPIELLTQWLAEARTVEPTWGAVMVLATTGADGRPSARAVLVENLGGDGVVFCTDEGSRKAIEFGVQPRAAGTFLWPGLRRQARFEGLVTLEPDAEADAAFDRYPRHVQIALWSVRQDEPVTDRAELDRRRDESERRFAGGAVPRPAWWRAYRLGLEVVELWIQSDDALHHRERFERQGAGWVSQLLAP